MTAPFGKPGSVRPDTLAALPSAMRAEGLLLMLEMGTPVQTVAQIAGVRAYELDRETRTRHPFRHLTEHQPARGTE